MQRSRRDSIPLFLSPRKKPIPFSLYKKHLRFRAGFRMPCSSSSLVSRIRSWLRDYDRIQALAVLLIYIQIACALIGSLGALFNGVLLVNLVVSLFALVAIEISSQNLGRTYAALLVCAILLDIGWFMLFSHTIWKLDPEKYGSFFVFSLRLAVLMQVIGFSVRFLSSFLWIQMYILGSSSLDCSVSRGADFDVRSSFLNPATNEVGSLNSNNDDFIGAATYDQAFYSSPFEDTQNKESVHKNRTRFVPPKMTVQQIVQERSRVTADKPFSKAKEAFDSQLNEFTKQQRSNTSHPSSSLKYHHNEGAGERHREHLAEAQSSYVSAWAKGISTSAQKERTDLLPPSMSPSLSAFSSPQSSTKEVFTSPDKLSIEHTPVGTKAISSFRTVSDVQFETSSSLQTALTFSSSMSPMNTKLLVKPTDARSLNFRSEGDISTHAASKSYPNSRPSVENDNSISSFSTPPDITSVGLNKSTASFDKVTSKNQSSGSIFNLVSDPQNPVLTPPSPGAFSFSTASVASSSLSTTSQATISFGKPSSGAKPVGVTNQRAPVSTVASTANSQFLPSRILFSQALNSADPTNTPVKPTLTLGVPSLDAKSFGESDDMGSIPLPEKSFPVTVSSLSTTLPSQTRSVPTLPVTSASTVDSVDLNKDSSNDQPPTTQSAVSVEVKHTLQSEKNLNATDSVCTALAASDPQPQMPSSAALLMSSANTKKNEELDLSLSQEDEMEEEAVDSTTVLSLGSLGGFGLGSSRALSSTKPNPFGAPLFPNNSSTTNTQATSFTVSPGEPFRAASFTLPPTPNPVQLMSQQPASSGGFPSGLGGGGLSGFGQPSHVGVGQQALGSVLGAFGQSRQPGVLPEVGFPSSTAFGGGGGGFSSASTGKFPAFGGFGGASAGGGGFTSVASPSSGFATAAKGIGGFAGVSSGVGGGFAGAGGGGFGSVATNSGFAGAAGGGFGSVAPNSGFASAAPGGVGGFGGAATAASGFTSGGFTAFGSSQGGAFSAFGQNSAPGSGKPPATLLTQMRK